MIRFSNFHYNREPSYFFIFLSQMYYTLTNLVYSYIYMTYIQNTITYFYMYLDKESYVTIFPLSIVYKITIDSIAKQNSFWYNEYIYTSKLSYGVFNNCMF